MKSRNYLIWLLSLVVVIGGGLAFSGQSLKVFRFNTKKILNEGWEEKVHTKKVEYSVVEISQEKFFQLVSKDAASGYFYHFKEPWSIKEHPFSSFVWRVDELPRKEGAAIDSPLQFARVGRRGEEGDPDIELSKKDQDDYLRIYFITDAMSIAFAKCLEYVWDVHRPPLSRLRSPWADSIRLLVLANKSQFGRWREEVRNVYEDFKYTFKKSEWDKEIAAIAFMADTDNTHGKTRAYLKEIRVGMRAEAKEPLLEIVWNNPLQPEKAVVKTKSSK